MSHWGRASDQPVERPALQPIEQFPTRPVLLLRGLTRRCPWCGDRRAYFTGWFKRHEHCRSCGHGFRRGDHAFELGATTANIILTFLGVLITTLVAVVVQLPGLDVFWVVGPAAAVAVIGPAVFYPVSFTLWQAIDLWMRQPTPAELAGESEASL